MLTLLKARVEHGAEVQALEERIRVLEHKLESDSARAASREQAEAGSNARLQRELEMMEKQYDTTLAKLRDKEADCNVRP